jgi:hypothetical protein
MQLDSQRGRWANSLARRVELAGFALRLPTIECRLSDSQQGNRVAFHLTKEFYPPFTHRTACIALAVPTDLDEYLAGRHRQALRTNLNRASRLGIVAKELEDKTHQLRAVSSVLESRDEPWRHRYVPYLERQLEDDEVRVFAAVDSGDAVLAVAVMAVDVSAAWLEIFCALRGEMGLLARYPLHFELVKHLGGRVLLTGSVVGVPPGVRYFQDRLGFQATNIRLRHNGK